MAFELHLRLMYRLDCEEDWLQLGRSLRYSFPSCHLPLAAQTKGAPALDADWNMSDWYLEQKVHMQPPARLQKRPSKTLDGPRGFYSDGQMLKTELFDKYRAFREVGKTDVLAGEEII